MPEVTVRVSGPLLEGRGPAVIQAFLDDATYEVAAQGLADVHLILDQDIKNPTPYYETQIISERASRDMVVHDRGVIYGPWLVGSSSRNRTTRFKGYQHFRRAAQGLQRKIPSLVEPILRRHLGRLG